MLILPERWPDETMCGLWARIARINGLRQLDVAGILTGEERPTSVIGCPVNIKYFCEVTKGAYGSPSDLLRQISMFPALAHLGVISASTLADVENGTTRPDLGMLEFGVSRGHYWRVCKKCMEQDAKRFGVAYWHRAHQLPTSQYCTEHGLKLDRVNLRRVQLHENLVLPFEVTAQIEHGSNAEGERNSMCFEVSILGRDVLADHSEQFSKKAILETYKSGLLQMGFLTGTGKVCFAEYLKKFGQEYEVKASSIASLLEQSKVNHPRQLLYGITNDLECRPFARVLLVRLLFGTWAAFKAQCRWNDVLGRGNNIVGSESQTLKGYSFAAMLNKNRQACLDYKASRIAPTRFEFMRVSYRVFRWLRQNDRMWLDEALPMQPRIMGQTTLFK